MITELVIVSAIVSAIVQVIKKITKISGLYALLTLVVISVVGAFIYTGFEVLGYWCRRRCINLGLYCYAV